MSSSASLVAFPRRIGAMFAAMGSVFAAGLAVLLGAGAPATAAALPRVLMNEAETAKIEGADQARAFMAILGAVLSQDAVEAIPADALSAVAGAGAAKAAGGCKGKPDERAACQGKALAEAGFAATVLTRVDGGDGVRIRMKGYGLDAKGAVAASAELDEKFASLDALIAGRSGLRARVTTLFAAMLAVPAAPAAAAEEAAEGEGAVAAGEGRRRRKAAKESAAEAEAEEAPPKKGKGKAAAEDEEEEEAPKKKGKGKAAAEEEEEEEAPKKKGKGKADDEDKPKRGRGRTSPEDTRAVVVDAYKMYLAGRVAGAIGKLEDAQTEPCRCDEDNKVNALVRDLRAVDEGLAAVREGVEKGNGPAAVEGGEAAREALDALAEFGKEIKVEGAPQAGKDLDTQLARAYVLTGEGHARDNQYIKAIEQWEKALKLDPANADAKERLAKKQEYAQKLLALALEERDLEPAKAKAMAEQALKLVPDEANRVNQQVQDLLDELEGVE